MTNNALEILNARFAVSTEAQKMLSEERAKSLAAMAIYEARTAAGLSPHQLAELVGVAEADIVQIEDADYDGNTLVMLHRIATALHQHLEIRFVPVNPAVLPEEEAA